MKKLLVLMLCLSLLCVLVACGNAEKKTEAPSGSDAPSATVDPSETETSSTEAPTDGNEGWTGVAKDY